MGELKVTSIEELKGYANGELVELPSFGNGQKFVAKLKRPSMLSLVRAKKIPNELLTSASTLFESGVNSAMHIDTKNLDENAMSQLINVMDIICEASFVEPTFKQLKEANIELTDEQYLAVFSYTQVGIKELNSFR